MRSVLKQANRDTINWNLVADDVPGRSQSKCYHRYIHLTREQVSREFQSHEDQLLIEQHRLQNCKSCLFFALLCSKSIDFRLFKLVGHKFNYISREDLVILYKIVIENCSNTVRSMNYFDLNQLVLFC